MSQVTIGVPIELIMDVFDQTGGLEGPRRFLLQTFVSPVLVNALVTLVRQTDTPDAYYLDKGFARGQLVDKSRNWSIKPDYEKALRELTVESGSIKTDFQEVKRLSQTLHFKRSRGATVNYLEPQHDIIFIWAGDSKEKARGEWYDITASNVPTRRRVDMPIPHRREGHFEITNPQDPRFRRACRYCSNRFTRRVQRCSLCKTARYCDPVCQKKDWKKENHKGNECAEYAKWRETQRESNYE